MTSKSVDVFDFFSGCGGTSLGFRNYGFNILGGLDFDIDAEKTFRHNFPGAFFLNKDIRTVDVSDISNVLKNRTTGSQLLFCGCAPCQPFSNQRKNRQTLDQRANLLSEFQRFIEHWQPNYVFLENVPGLQKVNEEGQVFSAFTDMLNDNGYKYDMAVVKASDLGVPQTRKRFILVASKNSSIRCIDDFIGAQLTPPPSVRDIIGDLPQIAAGEAHMSVPNHVAAKLSDKNLERIKHTPEGGDRRNWPASLGALDCHKGYKGHTDVYGRMSWDKIAATLTTKCTSYSNGRFGHPEQDRAISVREAARLQTFPDDFVFIGSPISCAKQVGNAVPPLMAQKISECFNFG